MFGAFVQGPITDNPEMIMAAGTVSHLHTPARELVDPKETGLDIDFVKVLHDNDRPCPLSAFINTEQNVLLPPCCTQLYYNTLLKCAVQF